MKSIRVKNLRSIIDSGEIDINRLNIFLGENSSGKSTILRLFPMLKETVNHELRGPLLWFGDSYDYGSFSESLSRQSDSQFITIEFLWDALSEKKHSRCATCNYYDRKGLGFLQSDTYKLSVSIGAKNDLPFFHTVSVTTDKHEIRLCTNNKNHIDIFIDGDKIKNDPMEWKYGVRGLLPDLNPINSKYDTPLQKIRTEINKMIPNSFTGKLLNADFEELFYIKSTKYEEIFAHVTNEKNPFGKLIKQSLNYHSQESEKFCNNIILSNIFRCLEYADSYVSTTFDSSFYMKPLRYSIGRYLRNRGLAVDSIDSSGENVLEFISSLDGQELRSLNKYLFSALKIKVSVGKKNANGQLFIETINGDKTEKYNIVDVGYGITQVLPIAIMLWDKARKPNDCEFYDIVVIEQPEVHLHPRMQESLAQLLISALDLSKSSNGELRLVVETHSSVLINRIGRYIREYSKAEDSNKGINEKDVSLYLFEKKAGITNVQKTQYDTSGRIQKWPIGFLD
ncbi:MAG: AAA family ATPase [Bacteroidales bacterium]|nr:AAA family ATPase [Bacteroidales bacterium]